MKAFHLTVPSELSSIFASITLVDDGTVVICYRNGRALEMHIDDDDMPINMVPIACKMLRINAREVEYLTPEEMKRLYRVTEKG